MSNRAAPASAAIEIPLALAVFGTKEVVMAHQKPTLIVAAKGVSVRYSEDEEEYGEEPQHLRFSFENSMLQTLGVSVF